jgi:hypothetical protein
VREFAKVDSSIAHVFGFHHLMLATVRLFSRPEQWQPWFEQTARRTGSGATPSTRWTPAPWSRTWRLARVFRQEKLLLRRQRFGNADRLGRGRKCRRQVADRRDPQRSQRHHLHDDWNNIGQRQTDSGSATFERVRVEESELLLDPGPLSTPFACLRPLIAQLTFTHMFLGIAEGAFDEARQYTLSETRRWHKSAARDVREDPYVLRHYGEFWVALEGVRLLVERPPRCSTRPGPKART